MRLKDIRAVVDIHMKELQGDVFPSLGKQFLTHLYELNNANPHAICFVYEADGIAKGFIVGTPNVKQLYAYTIQKGFFLLIASMVPQLIKSPALIKKLIDIALYPSTQKEIPAELLVLAVARDSQRQGIGRSLVETLEKEFIHSQIYRYKVITHTTKMDANKFYMNHGFVLEHSYQFAGKNWNLYTQHLHESKHYSPHL